MRFLYHARPPDMRGETLYPLNQLRSIDRALYEREQAKYEGREAVLEFRIPLIDVLWNDTLHLSTIHPYHLAAAWRAVGLWTPTLERPFFQIPVERVGRYQSVWFASESFWVNNSPYEDVPLAPPLEEFRLFNLADHREPGEAPRELLRVPAPPAAAGASSPSVPEGPTRARLWSGRRRRLGACAI